MGLVAFLVMFLVAGAIGEISSSLLISAGFALPLAVLLTMFNDRLRGMRRYRTAVTYLSGTAIPVGGYFATLNFSPWDLSEWATFILFLFFLNSVIVVVGDISRKEQEEPPEGSS